MGAVTLEAHQSVVGDRAKEITWQHDFYYGNGTKDRSMGVIDLPCVVGGQNMLVLAKKQITAPMTEGPSGQFEFVLCPREKDFGEGRTGSLRPSPTLYWSQVLKDSLPFERAGDLLEGRDPEMLSLPTERHPVTGEPRTLLRKGEVKQLLSMSECILEVRATTSGSDISVASFTDFRFDLTQFAGRHGIEIDDQASCAAGWNPLSSSGRQRFWHVPCTLAPSFPVAVQQWLPVSNPSELSLRPRFRSARDQLRLYVREACAGNTCRDVTFFWTHPGSRVHGHW